MPHACGELEEVKRRYVLTLAPSLPSLISIFKVKKIKCKKDTNG